MKSKQCQWCGDPFESSKAGREAKFCGPQCRLKAHRAAVPPPVCAVCGSEISGRRRQYCTEICRVKARLERLENPS